ncbi:hypothetical protein E8E13_006062 [Curvularia kusanoi]|uniref:Uncharacterized protein n=1 Tax=Curvularia kusanoi TaxID=90978 RepID=A0A9P4WCW7_CURKU|nr:hypothetical protein E8E13_006062 [Curvularia kusanoi]
MLRLKPSELTLTPEDVDEALYRMARRQQSRASAATAQRRVRYGGRPPSPRLMPGAQRFVGNDITSNGNVSIPRPLSQQAITEHVNDVSEGPNEGLQGPSTPANMRGGASHRTHASEEFALRAPNTEPLQKISQRQIRQRSYSSSDAPPSRLFRPRQYSSEASNASLAYSVYQLPESRQPSGGAYHSVRLSDAQALADNRARTSPPETVTAHISAATIRRASPLDTLITHTGREMQRLGNHEAHNRRNAQSGNTRPVAINSSNRWVSQGPHQVTYGSPPQMVMADDPYSRGRMFLKRLEQGSSKAIPPILGHYEQTDNFYDLKIGRRRG